MVHSRDEVVLRSVLRNKEPEPEMTMSLLFFNRGPTPATPFLRIYLKECNTGYSRGTCTPMFIAALFTIAKLWKQP
jgi:hypothetical protein